MVKLSCIPHKNLFFPQMFVFLMFLFSAFDRAEASHVTIDSGDATANYRSLDLFFKALDAMTVASVPDTVLFTGSKQYTYTASQYAQNKTDSKKMYFSSTATNPDNFPIINHTSQDFYNFFRNTPVSFERLIFTGSLVFDQGQANRDIMFSQCVIRNYKKPFFKFYGSTAISPYIQFFNCLFVNNTDTIFSIQFNNSYNPHLEITNCTFDNNNAIFSGDEDNIVNIVFKNNIFSYNKSTLPGPLLKSKTTYSITSEAKTGYDSTCYQLLSADSAALYKFPSRTKDTLPSHWKLGSTSKAADFLKTKAVLNVDIAGTLRGVAPQSDVGCWKFDNTLRIVKKPVDVIAVVNTIAVFTIATDSSTPVSYAWYRNGPDTAVISTKDTCLVEALPTRDSTRYWCVVSNSGGSKSSDTVTLRIMNVPVILRDSSEGKSVPNGDTASFTISATGYNLSYFWYLGTSTTPLKTDTTKPYCKIDTIKKPVHDNALLYCEVRNLAGKIKSLPDTLHVRLNLPVISKQPKDTSLFQGQTAKFSVTATGNGPILHYTWYKTDSTKTVKTKISGVDTSVLILSNVPIASSGSAYYCVVSTMFGDEKESDQAYLIVKPITAPVITDQSSVLETRVNNRDSLYVIFSSSGIHDTIQWYKDGLPIGGANSTVYNIPPDVMIKEGSYTYRCEVRNDYGKAISNDIKVTIHKIDEIFNPITLKGKFIDRYSVLLTIKSFTRLPVKNGNAPFADTIGVWYTTAGFQKIPDRKATNLIMFPLDVLCARGVNDSFDTLINTSSSMGDKECDSICFIATPFWKPDSLPAFISANGSKVYSCGTGSIINPLIPTISQSQIKNDVVTLNLSGFNNLKPSDVYKIVTFYGSNSGSFVYDTIDISEYPPADRYTKDYSNVLFSGLTHTISWGVYIRGIEGNYSDTFIDKQIQVGYPIPVNTAKLTVFDALSSEVVLNWTNISADSVRIWYGTDPIPLVDASQFPSKTHTPLTVSADLGTILISDLNEITTYYFGLQLQSHGVWSGTAVDASTYTTTKRSDTSKINNTIKITEAFFDSTTNKFKLKFTFDSTGSGKEIFNVRATYSKNSNDIEALPCKSRRINFLTKSNEDTMTIVLGDSLDFDTTYYISLWAQANGASWSEPTDSSKVPVKTSHLKWMAFSLFYPNESVFKTFEGKVLFKKGPEWYTEYFSTFKCEDILEMYNLNQIQIPAGFKAVSIGVKFRHPENLEMPEVYFGIKVDSLPKEYSLKDVNMYVYDTLTGKFKVIYAASDTTDSIFSVLLKAKGLTSPIMLMVDTEKPAVTVSDTTKVLTGDDFNYTIKIKDNVSNVSAVVKYGAGSEALTHSYKIDVSNLGDTLVPIHRIDYSTTSGLRALLIVTDGRFVDTINLSMVVSTNLVRHTEEMKWFPLCVHYELNSADVKQLFDSLSGPDKKYDNTKFRLFKWYDSLEYKTEVGKYVEYDKVSENDTLFDLIPGNLLWLKTRKTATLKFGEGKTLSLKKSYDVKLPPNTWTDVAVPFEYAIKIYDILQASGINSDSNQLIICKWNLDSLQYTTTSIHDPTRGEQSHLESDMSGGNNDVYTIYNHPLYLSDTVTLKFPPIPASMSKYSNPRLSKKQATSDWRFTITATTENEDLNPIYFAFSNGALKKTLIPVAPSLGSLRMGVVENGMLYGIVVSHEKADGYAYNLKFVNKDASKQSVLCNIVENVTSGMNMKLFDPITGTTQDIKAGFSVDVDGQSSGQRWLLMGNDAFIGKFIQKNVGFNLLQLYPNPFRGLLNIKFTIPLAGVNSVNCILFNALGRQVWDFKIDKELHTGLNVFVWQPGQGGIQNIASGTYFFKLVAKDANGKISGSKLAKLMYFTN